MRKGFLGTRKGFTIIELMVVVFIISILSATAIPMLGKYFKKSKMAEATTNIRKLYDGEVGYFIEERVDPATGGAISRRFIAASPQPPLPPGVDKKTGAWETTNFRYLKFGTDGPAQYCYEAVESGIASSAAFSARAYGDIDGDGSTSLFERTGSVDSVSGEVQGSPAIYELDPLE